MVKFYFCSLVSMFLTTPNSGKKAIFQYHTLNIHRINTKGKYASYIYLGIVTIILIKWMTVNYFPYIVRN